MRLRDNALLEKAAQEKYILFAYIAVFLANNFSELFFDQWLKPLYAFVYLWTLYAYIYHTCITRKYLSDKYYRMAQVFLLINVVCSFAYRANWRFSIVQDFAILILYIFICFGAFHDTPDISFFEKTVKLLLYTVFATSAASLLARFFAPSLLREISASRFRGFYTYYNIGANYGMASIVLWIYFLFTRRERRTYILFALNFLVQVLYMYFTKARTYILVLAVCLFLWGLIALHSRVPDRKSRIRMYLMISFVFALAAYILMFTKYGIGRNFANFTYKGHTFADLAVMTEEEKTLFLNKFTSNRYLMWQECFGAVRQSPIIGYGLKSAGFTYFVKHGVNAHNLFINALLFSGTVGTVWMTVYLFVIFRDSAKNCTSYAKIALWIFMAANLLVAQLETGLLYNGKDVSALCWAVFGLLTCRQGITHELY